jgi:hypothetical protein
MNQRSEMTCPTCGEPTEPGLLHAEEAILRFRFGDEGGESTGREIELQRRPDVRSFHLAQSLEPAPLRAWWCDPCQLVFARAEQ